MATGDVKIADSATPTKNVAVNTFTEDAETKVLQRVVINSSAGAEVDPATQTTLAAALTALNDLVTVFGAAALDQGSGATSTHTLRTVIASDQFGPPGPQTAANSTSVTPANSSDVTSSRVNSAASTNATNLKASAAVMRSIDLFNNAAYAVYVKLYNKATAPVVGTDTPIWTIPLPAGGGYSKQYFVGKPFSLGLSYAITKLQADSDTTVIAAGDVTGTIDWV